MDQKLKEEFITFIEANTGRKFYNNDVLPIAYEKILERKNNNKRTNVKAINSINKLIQYYLAGLMLDFDTGIDRYIRDSLPYSYSSKFFKMFDAIEYETPEIRVLYNPKIEFIDNEFYSYDKDVRIKLDYDMNEPVHYSLLKKDPELNSNCWENFTYQCRKLAGSVTISVPWTIKGKITFDKNTNNYKLSKVFFIANYPVADESSRNCITARYSGLRNTALICYTPLNGNRQDKVVENRDWDGDNINRGTVYITNYSGNILTSIKGDWDGYYNNLSFDKLLVLLEKTL